MRISSVSGLQIVHTVFVRLCRFWGLRLQDTNDGEHMEKSKLKWEIGMYSVYFRFVASSQKLRTATLGINYAPSVSAVPAIGPKV